MKAEFGELKDNTGEIRLLPESIDDLWHLQHLIAPGAPGICHYLPECGVCN